MMTPDGRKLELEKNFQDRVRSIAENAEKAVQFSQLVLRQSEDLVEYDIFGTGGGKSLLKTEEFSILLSFMDANSAFPPHQHDSIQIMTVLKGKFKLIMDGVEKEYQESETVTVPSGVPHQASSEEGCAILCTHIPDEDFIPPSLRSIDEFVGK